MKNLFLFLIFSFLTSSLFAQQDCQGGSSQVDLDINNISARLQNTGGLWWDGSSGKYIAPKPEIPDIGLPEISAIFAGGLWMGGYDAAGNLKLAAQTYGSGSTSDYFPGPISTEDGAVSPDACSNWDRHFPILKSEIDTHIADFEDNGIIDNPIGSVMSWPATGNVSFQNYYGFELPSTGQSLAPFWDINQDGQYNPEQGEYPLIKGDQAIWWVFNDIANVHTATNGSPLGIEIQVMAYSSQCEETVLSNTTFYEFTFLSRAFETIENFQTGLWIDFDLGCPADDFVGFDLDRNMAYAYNQDDTDGLNGISCGGFDTYAQVIPMIGVQLIEDTEDIGISNFGVIHGANSATSSPSAPNEFMNYMEGKWRDGTPFTEGGNGYGGTMPTNHLYTGEPTNAATWSLCSDPLPDADFRAIMSTGGNPIQPGQIKQVTYAVIFTENVEHPCPNLEAIQTAADEIVDSPCTQSTVAISDIKNEVSLKISPNPTRGDFQLSLTERTKLIEEFSLIDISGRLLRKTKMSPTQELKIQRENLSSGVYFVKVKATDGYFTTRKLVVQ